jgi:endoglucanase
MLRSLAPRKVTSHRVARIVALALLAASCSAPLPEESVEQHRASLAPRMLAGVNLAGAEFGTNLLPGVYGKDYIYPNHPAFNTLDYWASRGLTFIRMPFAWERMQRSIGGDLDASELALMDAFMDDAHARGMSVLLDCHNYAYYRLNLGDQQTKIGTSPSVPETSLGDLWKKLALRYKDHPALFGYDIMNEPSGLGDPDRWKRIAQHTIDAIRQVDTVKPVVVEGEEWANGYKWPEVSDNLKNLTDPANNLIFQAHIYFDPDFSGRYVNKDYAANSVPSPEFGADRIRPFVNWLKANNARGMLGEFSVPGHQEEWLTLLANFLDYLGENDDVIHSHTYWAGGPWWDTSSTADMAIEPANNGGPVSGMVDKPQVHIILEAKARYEASRPDTGAGGGAGTGGGAETGGTTGAGGATGTGGTGLAGAPGSAGTASNEPEEYGPAGEDDGCGCRLAGQGRATSAAWLAPLVFVASVARRRRRGR